MEEIGMSIKCTQRVCLTGLVKGRVQGVFFRAEAQAKAEQLGVAGWVRNTMDGDVEVLLQGPAESLSKMEEWLRIGPPRASVVAVELSECPEGTEQLAGFEIRR